jgi:hypothetical protein
MEAQRTPLPHNAGYVRKAVLQASGQCTYLAEGHHRVRDEGDAQSQCSHQRVAAHELSSLQDSTWTGCCSVLLRECLSHTQHSAITGKPLSNAAETAVRRHTCQQCMHAVSLLHSHHDANGLLGSWVSMGGVALENGILPAPVAQHQPQLGPHYIACITHTGGVQQQVSVGLPEVHCVFPGNKSDAVVITLSISASARG